MDNKFEDKFHWAYTKVGEEDGPIVKIEEVTQENRRQYRYFCPGCGAELFPVLCKEGRQNHFRHKAGEGHGCSFETYLHNTAKRLLKLRFDTKPDFPILVHAENMCDKFDNCLLRIESDTKNRRFQGDSYNNRIVCEKYYPKVIDLKKIYDTCELEKGYKGFIGDVKLSNSKDDSIVPMFLEICVHHACTPEKLSSGIPIIEFTLNDENDLRFLILDRSVIKEEVGRVKYHNYSYEDKSPYNDFKKGKYSLDRKEYYDSEGLWDERDAIVSCHDFWVNKHAEDSFADIVFFGGKSDLGFAIDCLWALAGKMKNHCAFCKYGKRRFLYNNPNSLYVECGKNKMLNYQKKDRRGNIVDCRDFIHRFTYKSLWGINCNDYELDKEKLKTEIQRRNAIGWLREKN